MILCSSVRPTVTDHDGRGLPDLTAGDDGEMMGAVRFPAVDCWRSVVDLSWPEINWNSVDQPKI